MLSILIPVHNYNCTALVHTLHQQCEASGMVYEILLGNDASTLFLDELHTLSTLSNIRMVTAKENIGRSKIRNLLADKAAYNTLLFIDCDADASGNPAYIRQYLPYMGKPCCVVGGTQTHPSLDTPETHLNYTYDLLRETQNSQKGHFTTFQFLIDKALFNKVRFDETISSYGFEDSFFGYEISQYTPILYIQNPLVHTGMRSNQAYLTKIDELCATLVQLYCSDQKETLLKVSKLARYVHLLRRLKLQGLMARIFTAHKHRIVQNLCSPTPKLRYLDLYKLGTACTLM